MRPSEWLTQHEWARKQFYVKRHNCEYGCILGAISHAASDTDTMIEQTLLLSTLCNQKYQKTVAEVNDTVLATKADAIALLQEMERLYYKEEQL